MSKYYPHIGPPITFGKIVVQLVAFPRHVHRQPPSGEPYYPKKLGYVIESWSEVTPIKDVYAFLSWQIEYERTVRYLDEEGNIVDEKPNSLWEEKHLQPLIELLEKKWVPTYPEIAHFLVNRIIKDPELMSAKECKAFLRKLDKLFKDCEPPDTSRTIS